jgi:hypothetical protein
VLDLAGQAAAALEEHAATLGPEGDRWRLLLAFHAGRAGRPGLDRAAARPAAEFRRQPAGRRRARRPAAGADDDRLRIHHALAANHATLGDYRQALTHGQHELNLRTAIQHPDHPSTLTSRNNIGGWTGQSGDAAAALRLARDLLPDQQRALGPDHPDTRGHIAACVKLLTKEGGQ